MSDINDQLSDTSSDFNWPLEAALEGHQHDRVVFENVADQYVKGENVPAFFTVLQDIKVNAEEDQIGLLRVRIRLLFFRLYDLIIFLLIGWLYQYKGMFDLCSCSLQSIDRI
jgi:hypothetical protein